MRNGKMETTANVMIKESVIVVVRKKYGEVVWRERWYVFETSVLLRISGLSVQLHVSRDEMSRGQGTHER